MFPLRSSWCVGFLLGLGLGLSGAASDEFTTDEAYYRNERQKNITFVFGKFQSNGHVITLNHQPFFPDESQTVPRTNVRYWDLPKQLFPGDVFESMFLQGPSRQFMQNEETLRFFVPEGETEEVIRFQHRFGRPPDGSLRGIEVSGRATIEIRDPKQPGKRFSLKFAKKIPKSGGGFVRALGRATIERSVKMSDIFYEILQTEGGIGKVGTYPETYGVYLDNWGFVLREHEAVGIDIPAGTGWEVPLHALFDTRAKVNLDLLAVMQGYAEIFPVPSGMSPATHWIYNHFIPTMASGLAQLLLVHGIVAELHTQNIKIILEIHPQTHRPTGRILGFIFIDACDGALDPSVRVLFGRHLFLTELAYMESRSVIGERVMGDAALANHADHVNAFFSQVVGAAVWHSTPNKMAALTTAGYLEDWEQRLYRKFLTDFLGTAQGWFTAAQLSDAPMLADLRHLISHAQVLDPARYLRAIPFKDDAPASYKGDGVLPTKGAMMMRVAAQVISQVVLTQVNSVLTLARQKPFLIFDGAGQLISSLRFKFQEALSYRRVAFLNVEDSEKRDWVHQPETDFWEIENVGIVAYRWIEEGGRSVPLPIAIAPPVTAMLTKVECAELVAAGTSAPPIRNNRYLPKLGQFVEAAQILEEMERNQLKPP